MLRLTVSPEEYLMINDNIKIVFLGGTKNHLRIMIDAPREVNIVRSTVLENQITDPEQPAILNCGQVFRLSLFYRKETKTSRCVQKVILHCTCHFCVVY